LFGIADAGRWSLLRRGAQVRPSDNEPSPVRESPGVPVSSSPGAHDVPPRIAQARQGRPQPSANSSRLAQRERRTTDPELIEFVVHTLLKRYGVICWRLLAREPQWLPPWRELLRVCHRLEARGEIRGGRFIAGLTGEQFALPEAIGLMRGVRQKAHDGALVSISGADPLNLVGYVVAGNKVPNQAGARVLYRDGTPIATLVGGQFTALEPMDDAAEWAARSKLLRAQSEYAPAEPEDSIP
jgi:ATP-dependent Lhr-like helicase